MRLEAFTVSGMTRFTDPVSVNLRDLPAGLIAFVGRNGEGKTTLIEAGPASISSTVRARALWACLRRRYSTPERVRLSPCALTKSSGTRRGPLTASQARSAAAVVFHNGKHRCRRPFPRISRLA